MAVGVGRQAGDTTAIGAAIRRHRLTLGMSVARVAEDVGVRPSEVGRWERGEADPPPTRVRALARVLGVDQATMLSWIADAAAPAAVEVEGEAVHIVIDLAPPDPFVTISHRPVNVDMIPTRRVVEPVRPIRPRPVASVFPAQTFSLDADRHVYSPTAGFPQEVHPRLHSTARTARTAVALVALGIALAWAFDQLGEGVGDLLDLFGGSGAVPGG